MPASATRLQFRAITSFEPRDPRKSWNDLPGSGSGREWDSCPLAPSGRRGAACLETARSDNQERSDGLAAGSGTSLATGWRPPSRYALQWTFDDARRTRPANRSRERRERLAKVGGESGIRACSRRAEASRGVPGDCSLRQSGAKRRIGGESGIRTHGRVSPTHAFQACSIDHSDISPFRINDLRTHNDQGIADCDKSSNVPRSLTGFFKYSRAITARSAKCPPAGGCGSGTPAPHRLFRADRPPTATTPGAARDTAPRLPWRPGCCAR